MQDSETGIGEGKDDIDTKNRLQDNTNMTASILQGNPSYKITLI